MSENRFDPELIRQLAEVLRETDLSEIKYEMGDVKIKIVSRQHPEPPIQASAPVALHPAVVTASDKNQDVEPTDFSQDPGAIKAPMVGNVYLAPEPGATPFVQEGDSVSAGETLLIIEAMKVMNPIRAPKDGVVKKITVHNAAPVEFDEVLMILE